MVFLFSGLFFLEDFCQSSLLFLKVLQSLIGAFNSDPQKSDLVLLLHVLACMQLDEFYSIKLDLSS